MSDGTTRNQDPNEKEEEEAGTTEVDYRWQWLSTIWSLCFGLGFPVALTIWELSVSAPVMATLLLGWGSTVVYVVGPENVKAFQKLKGGE